MFNSIKILYWCLSIILAHKKKGKYCFAESGQLFVLKFTDVFQLFRLKYDFYVKKSCYIDIDYTHWKENRKLRCRGDAWLLWKYAILLWFRTIVARKDNKQINCRSRQDQDMARQHNNKKKKTNGYCASRCLYAVLSLYIHSFSWVHAACSQAKWQKKIDMKILCWALT